MGVDDSAGTGGAGLGVTTTAEVVGLCVDGAEGFVDTSGVVPGTAGGVSVGNATDAVGVTATIEGESLAAGGTCRGRPKRFTARIAKPIISAPARITPTIQLRF